MADILNYGERHPDYPEVTLQDLATLQFVSNETGYGLKALVDIYGLESNYGRHKNTNKGLHQGPFQFGEAEAKELGIDRYDLYESAKGFVQSLGQRKQSLKNNITSTSGDFSFIDSLQSDDPVFFDYLLHQQGGKGIARLSNAYTEDSTGYYNLARPNMMSNLSDTQIKGLIDTNTYQDAINHYINSTKKNLGRD